MGEKGQTSMVHEQQNIDFISDLGHAAQADGQYLGHVVDEAGHEITGTPWTNPPAGGATPAASSSGPAPAAPSSPVSPGGGGPSGEKGQGA